MLPNPVSQTDHAHSDLLGELADALQLLYQCHSREVPVTPQLLNHIDSLLDRVEQCQLLDARAAGEPHAFTAAVRGLQH